MTNDQPTYRLSGGRLAGWESVHRACADRFIFQWQDLDGFQLRSLPEQAPFTSLLHGWDQDGTNMIRVRWDGETAFVACLSRGCGPLPFEDHGDIDVETSPSVPWGNYERIAQARSMDESRTRATYMMVRPTSVALAGTVFFALAEGSMS